MTEITPPYYAYGTYKHQYTLKGSGFNELPNDAIAVPMVNNDEPLALRYNTSTTNVMQMTRISNNEVIFEAGAAVDHSTASIGAILSNDREIVYWENTTRPIPS